MANETQAIYLLIESSGEYDTYQETVVRAYTNMGAAEADLATLDAPRVAHAAEMAAKLAGPNPPKLWQTFWHGSDFRVDESSLSSTAIEPSAIPARRET